MKLVQWFLRKSKKCGKFTDDRQMMDKLQSVELSAQMSKKGKVSFSLLTSNNPVKGSYISCKFVYSPLNLIKNKIYPFPHNANITSFPSVVINTSMYLKILFKVNKIWIILYQILINFSWRFISLLRSVLTSFKQNDSFIRTYMFFKSNNGLGKNK